MLVLTNEYRESMGLDSLTWDEDLADVADIRAREIVVKWDHERPDGSNFVKILDNIHYPSPLVGENLGKLQNTPEEVIEQWIASPLHEANLSKEEFTKLGVSCYIENGNIYWVQIFAK